MIDNDDDDWSADESRASRDRAQCYTEKCDGCWDVARYIAEVPRVRKIGAKEHDMPPARFRLCRYHGKKLLASDRQATIHEIREQAGE